LLRRSCILVLIIFVTSCHSLGPAQVSTQVLTAEIADADGAVDTDTVVVTVNEKNALEKPNIVVIFTDDQRWDMIGSIGVNAQIIKQFGRPVMPNVESLLVDNGVLFTNAFVTTPLCCPDRASILSGGFYAHNTGVLTNKPPNGGAAKFKDTETLSTLLQDAGYKTALIGKYMNGYPQMAPHIPPGWTRFVVHVKKKSWFDYAVVVGSSGGNSSTGTVEQHTQYLTDFTKDQSLQFLDQTGDSPFFLFLSTNAPHRPAAPAPGDEDLFLDYKWRGRAYGEDDLRDKPNWIRERAKSRFEQLISDEVHRNQLRSMQAVDRAVEAIVDKIDGMGKLDQTVFIFTSDNGYMWGEHKIFGKNMPYEEAIRVPLVIRMPGIARRTDDHLVPANLDIGATILSLAGITKVTDGLSLAPLLNDPDASWRADFMVESFTPQQGIFAGLRTEQWKYVEYTTGEKELYDLASDPYEEESQHNNTTHHNIMQELHDRLEPQKGLAITLPKRDHAAEQNVPYQLQLTAWGSRQPYTWSIVEGQLPQGLFLSSSSGLISGTPYKPERQTVSIKVVGSSIATHTGALQSYMRELTFLSKAPLTHGPMVGAVTDSAAKIWFRTESKTSVQVEYAADPDFDDDPMLSESMNTHFTYDLTATITLSDLASDTIYYYRILIDGVDQTPTPQPHFKTFPENATSVKIGILTDIGTSLSQTAPAIESLFADNPDFVIVLGDWDHRNVSELKEMRIMHQETRGDETVSGATFRDNILYHFPVAHVWDDHDYANNNSDKTFTEKAAAIQAYDEYWPSYERPNAQAGIWHKFHYGDLVEVFMLDVRSQRDVNTYKDPDYEMNGGSKNRDELRNNPCRSLLDGDACPENRSTGQKQWLKEGLLHSTALWKVIASSVPWNPTTPKDDAWWDFKAEQDELLEFIHDNNIEGVMVVSGDIHIGGAIDNGVNAGIPEMNVPTTNIDREGNSCKLHKPFERSVDCGEWSEGFVSDGVGYGVITLSPTAALIEAKDEFGNAVSGVSPLSLNR